MGPRRSRPRHELTGKLLANLTREASWIFFQPAVCHQQGPRSALDPKHEKIVWRWQVASHMTYVDEAAVAGTTATAITRFITAACVVTV